MTALFSIYGCILFSWVIFSLVFRWFSFVFLWPKPSDFLLSHPNFNCSQCRRTRSHSIGFKHWLMTLGFLLDCYLGTPPNKSFIWMPGHLPFSAWIDVINKDCLNLSFICFFLILILLNLYYGVLSLGQIKLMEVLFCKNKVCYYLWFSILNIYF